jgi:hypothetical protein
MDPNIWFYTFSTAAQVMASIVGLFAVFVVYKIQDFSGLLSNTREALIKIIVDDGANVKGYQFAIRAQDALKLSDLDILNKFHELVQIKETQPDRIGSTTTLHVGMTYMQLNSHTYSFFYNLVQKRRVIFAKLRIVLIYSLGCVALSLIALVMKDTLIGCSYFIWFSLLAFLGCLAVVGRGIYDIALQ